MKGALLQNSIRLSIMRYNHFEKIVSKPRLNRYLKAVKSDHKRAIELYKLNLELSQSFYPYLSLCEVALRNSINSVLVNYFNDPEWIKAQNRYGGFIDDLAKGGDSYLQRALEQVDYHFKIRNRRSNVPLNQDRFISEVSIGFWTRFFKPNHYKILKGRPIQIFTKLPRKTKRGFINSKLQNIEDFRNRVYHNEAICFSSTQQVNLSMPKKAYEDICSIIEWIEPQLLKFAQNLSDPLEAMDKITRLSR